MSLWFLLHCVTMATQQRKYLSISMNKREKEKTCSLKWTHWQKHVRKALRRRPLIMYGTTINDSERYFQMPNDGITDTHTHARATHTYFKRTDLLYATTSTECTLLLLKSNIINVLLIHILQGFKTLFFSIEHVCNSNPYSLILSPPRQSYILQLIYINWNRAPSTRSNRQKKKSSDDDDLNRMRSCTSLVSCVASIALFSYFTCQL